MAEFLRNRVSLAPLVRGSDLSYRMLARYYGAEVTYTPMVVASYYLQPEKANRNVKVISYEFDPTDRPLFLQLASSNSQDIITMANLPEFVGHVDGVDLNCGCPQGYAIAHGHGAGLLTKFGPDHLVTMCEEIVKGIKFPLTVKMRFYKDLPSTIDLIRRLRDVGVKAFCVHGRYHWMVGQARGLADWEWLKEIKKQLPDVVIIGNGDVKTHEQVLSRMEGLDGVMVGYGALRDPTVFGKSEPLDMVIQRYINLAWKHKNHLVHIHKHLYWLLRDHLENADKQILFASHTLEETIGVLNKLKIELKLTIPDEPCMVFPIQQGRAFRKKRKLEQQKLSLTQKVASE